MTDPTTGPPRPTPDHYFRMQVVLTFVAVLYVTAMRGIGHEEAANEGSGIVWFVFGFWFDKAVNARSR